jgi:hypothetical protein
MRPSYSLLKRAVATSTVISHTGSMAVSGSATVTLSLKPPLAFRATSSPRIATAISSCSTGPRSSPAGARTRDSASSVTPRSCSHARTEAARFSEATRPT